MSNISRELFDLARLSFDEFSQGLFGLRCVRYHGANLGWYIAGRREDAIGELFYLLRAITQSQWHLDKLNGRLKKARPRRLKPWYTENDITGPMRIGKPSKGGSLPLKTRLRIFKRDGHQCTLCGVHADDGYELTVDHIIPKSKGGSDRDSNLRAACVSCNSRKGDRMPKIAA